jgi:hypothetical protein
MNRQIVSPLAGMLPAGSLTLPGTVFAQGAGHGTPPVFKAFDHDANGLLDGGELQAYLERRRLPASCADLWRYETVDSDGDGVISLAEWSSALAKELKRGTGDTE